MRCAPLHLGRENSPSVCTRASKHTAGRRRHEAGAPHHSLNGNRRMEGEGVNKSLMQAQRERGSESERDTAYGPGTLDLSREARSQLRRDSGSSELSSSSSVPSKERTTTMLLCWSLPKALQKGRETPGNLRKEITMILIPTILKKKNRDNSSNPGTTAEARFS